MYAARAAEDTGPAEDDGGDGGEFVASAGVGAGFGDARDEDDRGETGDGAVLYVSQCEAALDGSPA